MKCLGSVEYFPQLLQHFQEVQEYIPQLMSQELWSIFHNFFKKIRFIFGTRMNSPGICD